MINNERALVELIPQGARLPVRHSSLLLVTQVPLGLRNGTFFLDEHTCKDLAHWATDLGHVVMACPLNPAPLFDNFAQYNTIRAVADLPHADRIEIVPLPYAYKFSSFVRNYQKTRRLLSEKIQECDYLCFLASLIIGDWASVAALEAIRLQRDYAFLADRVEYEVIRRTLQSYSLKGRIKEMLTLPFTKPFIRHLVERSRLGLFQGFDCYEEFSPFCENAHCIYHVSTQKSDQISAEHLNQKLEDITLGHPLRICYVGRAEAMKGAIDWVNIIYRVHKAGINVQATWFGQGSLIPEMKHLAVQFGILDRIHFPGFVSDRQTVLEALRQHHLLMFCHKTPESPRCLIESLVSGCPIIGYRSAYAENLVKQCGGGIFVDLDDQPAIANQIIQLHQQREDLAQLVRQAAMSGKLYDEDTLFQQRSQLLKQRLAPNIPSQITPSQCHE
jgi:glycosyltransferase involved in cell wall biosynthesis